MFAAVPKMRFSTVFRLSREFDNCENLPSLSQRVKFHICGEEGVFEGISAMKHYIAFLVAHGVFLAVDSDKCTLGRDEIVARDFPMCSNVPSLEG